MMPNDIDKKEKLSKAIANYNKIMKEIAPFIKKKEEKRYSTKGNWSLGKDR